jgi:hypothetical protein
VLRFRVSVIEARNIPITLSTHVNARFTFFQHAEVRVRCYTVLLRIASTIHKCSYL